MLKEIIDINPWWSGGYVAKNLLFRPLYTKKILNNTALIDIITGTRRVGKTTIMKELIVKILKKTPKKNLLYITGELPSIQSSTILEIFKAYKQYHNIKNNKTYLFIDEAQEIPNWQQEVKFIYDNYKVKIYLTGSSGLILNKYTSKLTGRFLQTHVFPLNFKEFLRFKNLKPNKQSLEKYLDIGGYPEVVLQNNKPLLAQTIDSIMYRDLLSHYGIRNPAILKDLLKLLCDKMTTSISFENIAKDLKIDVQTAKFYLQYLQDVYLIYPLYRLGKTHKIVKGFSPKYYINDPGILKLYSTSPRIGHLAENAVFTHLHSHAIQNHDEVFYHLENKQEIDFVYQNKKFEVKMKALTDNISPNTTYIVDHLRSQANYTQIPLQKFLYAPFTT